MKKYSFILILILISFSGNTQSLMDNSEEFNKKRTLGVSIFNGVAWGGSISALNFVWYKDFQKSKFHFFDDSKEWMQMDKMGHWTVSWLMARTAGDLYEWSGINHKHAALLGAGYSFAYMATFEMLDGFSADWGFSLSDVAFNGIGSFTYAIQEYVWDQQFIKLQFSSHRSGLAQYRPEVLGSNWTSQLLKDYNGQTYWLSFNPFHWLNSESKVPKWLNFSIGYGVADQLIGDGGTYVVQDGNTQLTFEPYRQLYFSFGIDLEEIPVKSPFLKMLFRSLNIVKFPFPALELSRGNLSFRPFYF